MSIIWSKKIDEILSIGFFLGDIGIKNWAFTREVAINVIAILEKSGIGILGGDVFICKDKNIEITYDSWFIDRDSEGVGFVKKSCSFSKEYILNYSNDHAMFSIVPYLH